MGHVPAGDSGTPLPKKVSGIATNPGLTETSVRDIGLAAGVVDYKVCAIDAIWSGLKFARRK